MESSHVKCDPKTATLILLYHHRSTSSYRLIVRAEACGWLSWFDVNLYPSSPTQTAAGKRLIVICNQLAKSPTFHWKRLCLALLAALRPSPLTSTRAGLGPQGVLGLASLGWHFFSTCDCVRPPSGHGESDRTINIYDGFDINQSTWLEEVPNRLSHYFPQTLERFVWKSLQFSQLTMISLEPWLTIHTGIR